MASLYFLFGLNLAINAGDPHNLRLRTHYTYNNNAAYSPDGKYFVLGGLDLVLYDAVNHRRIVILNPGNPPVTALDFSGDSSTLAVEYKNPDYDNVIDGYGHQIVLIAIPSGKILTKLQGLITKSNNGRTLRINTDKTRIATSDRNGIKILDINTGETVWQHDIKRRGNFGRTKNGTVFDCTPDWKYFLMNMERIQYPSGETEDLEDVYGDKVESVFFELISPDGRFAFATKKGYPCSEKLIDIQEQKVIAQNEGKYNSESIVADPTFSIFYTPNGFWNWRDNVSDTYSIDATFQNQGVVALSPDGKEITAYNAYLPIDQLTDDHRKEYKISTWQPYKVHSSLSYPVFGSEGEMKIYNNNSKSFIYSTNGRDSVEWEKLPKFLNELSDRFGYGPITANPSMTVAADQSARLYYPQESGREPEKVVNDFFMGGYPCFLDDDRLLFLTRDNLYLYDVKFKKLHKLPFDPYDRHMANNLRITVSPNGNFYWTRERSMKNFQKQRIQIRDANNHIILATLFLVQDGDASCSWDSTILACFDGKRIRFFDSRTWDLLDTLMVEQGEIRSLAFSPEGEKILIVNNNGLHQKIDRTTGRTLNYIIIDNDDNVVLTDPDGSIISQIGTIEDLVW